MSMPHPDEVDVLERTTEVAGDVSKPSFFNLLEDVSPHVQSVLLDKCTVAELSSLAVVSRSLRSGALATMAKRSLDIFMFAKNSGYRMILVVDRTDSSRNVCFDFCRCVDQRLLPCRHWPKIQKIVYFCSYARAVTVYFDEYTKIDEMVNCPNQCVMKSAHGILSKLSPLEVFVDEVESNSADWSDLMEFVSPKLLRLPVENYPDLFNSAVRSRGMQAAHSVILFFDPYTFDLCVTDHKMLKLRSRDITIHTTASRLLRDEVDVVHWTPVGVSMYIQQWLQRSRVIEHIQSFLSLRRIAHRDFGQRLVEAIGKLNLSPQIELLTALDDNLKDRLQVMDGKKIYGVEVGFGPHPTVIRVTADDGRQLTIVVSEAWDIEENSPTAAGFIDIFSSN